MSEYSSSSSESEESSSEEEEVVVPVKSTTPIERSESDASEEDEKDDQGAIVPSFLSLASRKSFPFAYWFIYTSKEKQAPPSQECLDKIKTATLSTIEILFKVAFPPEIYILRGSREKDRLRVICPTIQVNAMTALHVRSLILDKLGYRESSHLIPSAMYRFPTAHPTVLLERQFDIAKGRLESRQTYSCYIHTGMKTEELENKLNLWASYSKPAPLTTYSDRYTQFLEQKKDVSHDDNNYENPPEMEEDSVFDKLLETEQDLFSNIPKRITEETKQKLGPRLDQCVDFFHRFHPDSKLRGISFYKEKIFLFDFTKSDRTCKICNVKHSGNRQYLVYSTDSQKVFYHCHDQQAKGKSISWPLKERRRGADVVTLD